MEVNGFLSQISSVQILQPYIIKVGFDVLTAVVKNAANIWHIAPCGSYVNRRFEGTYYLHLQGLKSAKQETSA
jgi:hypothetical protein